MNTFTLHHGSDDKPITKFDKPTFFFIDSPDIASSYGLTEGRKRVLKRMYYVWDAIYRQMPTIKELDEHSYEQLRELFRTTNPTKRIRTNTDPVMESRSQIAADIIDGLVVDPYAIRSSVSKRWNIRVDTTARDLFLDGFM